MNKNILSILAVIAAVSVCQVLSAQSYWSMSGNSATSSNFIGTTNDAPFRIKTNGFTRMTFSDYKTGIGTDYPTANLQLHSEYMPEAIPGLDPPGRDLILNYENWFRMTTPTTGTGDEDGFSIKQHTLDVTMRQFEEGNLEIFGYNGKGMTILTDGTLKMGNGGVHAMMHIGSYAMSPFSGSTAYIGFNVLRSGSNWTLQSNGLNNGGAVIWCDITGDLYFANIASSTHSAFAQTLTTANMISHVNLMLRNDGLLQAKEVKVTLTGWPDYVFGEDYKLMSLGETEQYIKENGHLPGVPSAQEVEEEGLSLGEMNARLMQKVEELTLHVIELQKQIDELKKEK